MANLTCGLLYILPLQLPAPPHYPLHSYSIYFPVRHLRPTLPPHIPSEQAPTFGLPHLYFLPMPCCAVGLPYLLLAVVASPPSHTFTHTHTYTHPLLPTLLPFCHHLPPSPGSAATDTSTFPDCCNTLPVYLLIGFRLHFTKLPGSAPLTHNSLVWLPVGFCTPLHSHLPTHSPSH